MYLYGASGHAKVIIDILLKERNQIQGLFDDNPQINEVYGFKCFGKFDVNVLSGNQLIVSIGNNAIRKKVVDKIGDQVSFGTALDSSALISQSVVIAEGTAIMANSVINADTKVGKHVIINTSASVDHECTINDFAHVSPNATLCGNVVVGEGSHIGAAAVILPGIRIGKWCTIGAGSVIIKDVPDFSTVVGNPGRIIKNKKIGQDAKQ